MVCVFVIASVCQLAGLSDRTPLVPDQAGKSADARFADDVFIRAALEGYEGS